MNDKYTKIVYKSDQIGKEKIILYLTTFDLETFERNEKLEKIPTKKQVIMFEYDKYELNNSNLINELNNRFEDTFNKIYKEQLEQMQKYIETLRKIKIAPMEYNSNVKNITNSDDVHCNIVYGNIMNCDNVTCNEIKGSVVNCDNIYYKE